jgi:acyl-ACP thioesterase
MKAIWEESFSLDVSAVDPSDRMTLASVFEYFQEAASRHAEDLGCGREPLLNAGQAWVLSRMTVLMEKRPKQLQNLVIETWPRGWEHLFAMRDLAVRDENGGVWVRGRSAWLVLDMKRRRPIPAKQVMSTLPLNEGKEALPGGAQGLKTLNGLAKSAERRAAYSDIDYNGHVNNARYVQWVQDIADNDKLVAADTMRFDINYLSEVKRGDIVEFWTAPLEEAAGYGLFVEGRLGEKPCFRAELRAMRLCLGILHQ